MPELDVLRTAGPKRPEARSAYAPSIVRAIYQGFFLAVFLLGLWAMTDEGIRRFPVTWIFFSGTPSERSRSASLSDCMQNAANADSGFSNRDLAIAYRRAERALNFPFASITGIPRRPHSDRKFGHNSVSCRM